MISREEVESLARLARIELRSGEVESLQKDISEILEYVSQLSGINTPEANGVAEGKVVPTHHNILRADTPHTPDSLLAGKREALLHALPRRKDDYAVVRKIIQKDE
jgi:aspartyl-tRNA(Asn)/glutamyl-tRNA(Gln) amidotransferase subunit C